MFSNWPHLNHDTDTVIYCQDCGMIRRRELVTTIGTRLDFWTSAIIPVKEDNDETTQEG